MSVVKFIRDHKEMPVVVKTGNKDTIPLKGNSANSKFCLYDGDDGSKMLIKIQMSRDNDPICTDAIVNRYLNYVIQRDFNDSIAKHFMTIRGSFAAPVRDRLDYVINTNANMVPSTLVNKGTRKIQAQRAMNLQYLPSVVINRVSRPKTVCSMGQQIRYYGPALCAFFKALIDVGRAYGFSHSDMHAANVLMDLDTKQLVLIDYGRAHMVRPQVGSELEDYIKEEKAYAKTFQGNSIYARLAQYHYEATYVAFRHIKANDENMGMYVLNDIGGFSVLACDAVTKYDTVTKLEYLSALDELYDIIADRNIMTPESIKNAFKDLLNNRGAVFKDPFFRAVCIGLLWIDMIRLIYAKTSIRHRDAVIVEKANLYCVVDPDEFAKIHKSMGTCYRHYFVPLIDVWKDLTSPGKTSGVTTRSAAIVKGGNQEELQEDSWDDVLRYISERRDAMKDVNEDKYMKHVGATLEDSDGRSKVSNAARELNTRAMTPSDIKDIVVDALDAKRDASTQSGPQRRNVPAVIVQATRAGGAAKRAYKVISERGTGRKYVNVKRGFKWYLDEHRGQYRYVDTVAKTMIVIKGQV